MEHFGQTSTHKGKRLPSNQDWNDMIGAVTNVKIGTNNFAVNQVDEFGTRISNDAFFFPHVAQIDFGNEDAIIGPQREDEEYPYIDAIAVQKVVRIDVFEFRAGAYHYANISDTDTSSVSVLFTEPSETTPLKPADNDDYAIVGYRWDLVPFIEEVVFEGDFMYVEIHWEPEQAFEVDTQASVYSLDSGEHPTGWAASSEDSEDNTTTYQELLDEYLGEGVVTLSPAANEDVADKVVQVPIGAYQWDIDQAKLDRVIQLYFGGSAPSSNTTPVSGTPYRFQHPFQAVCTQSTVTVGHRRSDTDYQFKDYITITDPETDTLVEIEYATPETLDLDPAINTDYYVYYDIYKNGSSWVSTLEKSETWPPAVSPGNIAKCIGYAGSSDGVYIWGQEMFDCPNEQPANIRGEFEPYYQFDGSVTIMGGTVETFDETSVSVSEDTFSLGTPQDIWVKITSTESTSTPDVEVNASLQSGTYPGLYKSVSSAEKNFNYKIGEITGGVYVPSHKGRLHIDNTLLTPDIDSRFTSADQTPRFMAFDDAQPILIGDDSNDYLMKGVFLNTNVRGGGIESMEEDNEVTIYGLTKENFSQDVFDTIDTDTEDEVTFEGYRIDMETDAGVTQILDNSVEVSPVVLSAIGKWVGIEKGGVWKHKNSPVSSEVDDEHWFSTGELVISGSTETIELFFDNKGHCWMNNEDVQPTVTNYRYQHCSDMSSYPDIILSTQSSDAIRIDDECYQFIGETEDDLTSPIPTIGGTFGSCLACEESLSQDQWKKCADDTDAAVLSDAHTDVDYAWLCLGGAWVKCYNDAPTALTATDPAVLKQCGVSVPTSCDDLVGWPVSDDFGGSDCNSGTIGDANWSFRWIDDSDSEGTISITAGALELASGAGNFTAAAVSTVSTAINLSGDFTAEINFNITQMPSDYQRWIQFSVTLGADVVTAFISYNLFQASTRLVTARKNSTATSSASSATSGKFTISRVSGTVYVKLDGVTIQSYASTTGNLTKINMASVSNDSAATSTICKWDNISLLNGSSEQVYIDPTGKSCT